MVYVVPILCFVLPLILGVVFMRRQVGWMIPVSLLIGVVAIYWAISQGQQEQGWDGIGYAIFAVLMVAPAMLGLVIGGLIGWVQRRRAQG